MNREAIDTAIKTMVDEVLDAGTDVEVFILLGLLAGTCRDLAQKIQYGEQFHGPYLTEPALSANVTYAERR